jgi:hypothetical protein
VLKKAGNFKAQGMLKASTQNVRLQLLLVATGSFPLASFSSII